MIQRGLLREHASLIGQVYMAADLLMIALAALVAYFVRFRSLQLPLAYIGVVALGLLLALVIFSSAGVNEAWRGRTWFQQMRALTFGWGAVIISLVVLGFLFKVSAHFSRQWVGYWGVLGWAFLLAGRGGTTGFLMGMRRRGWNTKRVVIVGVNDMARDVARRVRAADWTGWQVTAFFDDPETPGGHDVDGVPVVGGPETLEPFVQQHGIDEIWLCLPLKREELIARVRHELRHCTATQRLIPDLSGLRLMQNPLAEVLGMPAVYLNASPMHGTNRLIKAVEDRLLAALILVLVSPLMLVIAVGVRLSSRGPVIYRQQRHGSDGRAITIYKFRTMVEHREPPGRVVQAQRNDGRVTRFGAFLRRTSLDELPQFVNVLQGRMSIVGPRPHALEHNEFYKELIGRYMQRHRVKPGITGWAQVNGLRGETQTLDRMKRRVEYDLYYIENWSLWFDLEIILMTLYRGFVHRNAY
ncbi:MAG TPA: undecaprenyl-phosphate glucose phosphotransferase [Gammaproteobacteria bacterium]|nr:undecaprenyl-phosphate glucose phosphotransferase [Gammaproteobacteria bacterium]